MNAYFVEKMGSRIMTSYNDKNNIKYIVLSPNAAESKLNRV